MIKKRIGGAPSQFSSDHWKNEEMNFDIWTFPAVNHSYVIPYLSNRRAFLIEEALVRGLKNRRASPTKGSPSIRENTVV